MKNRKRKPVLNKRAKNTLRIDPTRTGLLRRRFVAELKRRFSRIKVAILKLVVDEDAFGLKERSRDPFALNAFCATGEGGGIDPTCSPGGGPDAMVETSRFTIADESSSAEKIQARFQAIASSPNVDMTKRQYLGRVSDFVSGAGDASDVLVFYDPVARQHAAGSSYSNGARIDLRPGAFEGRGSSGSLGGTFLHELEHTLDVKAGKELKEYTPRIRELIRRMSKKDAFDLLRRESGEDSAHAMLGRAFGADRGHELSSEERSHAVSSLLSRARHLIANAGSVAVTNRWRFDTNPEKLRQFKEWLRAQFNATLRGKSDEELWAAYIEAGFRKGAGRAFDDTNRRTRWQRRDFYEGTRSQFLRTAFGQPESVDKVKLLASRSFDDLENVTADMATKMTRALTDGLVQGKGPREIARDLNAQTDMGQERALTIARTEIIRAHAEGQLTALEDLGVEEVGVTVEWMITDDEALCPKCAAMQGVILKLSEAHGLIPAHPNCRCAFAPYVGIGGDKVKDTKSSIDKAITRARDVSGDDEFGPESVSRERPRSILDDEGRELRVLSRFLGDHE
jgi:SPP1 gp7 family putative phage head morphogenesis protein